MLITLDASPDGVFSASAGGAATSGGALVGSLALQDTSATAMHAATVDDRSMKRSYDRTQPPTSESSRTSAASEPGGAERGEGARERRRKGAGGDGVPPN